MNGKDFVYSSSLIIPLLNCKLVIMASTKDNVSVKLLRLYKPFKCYTDSNLYIFTIFVMELLCLCVYFVQIIY